jgi:hypothetical protein
VNYLDTTEGYSRVGGTSPRAADVPVNPAIAGYISYLDTSASREVKDSQKQEQQHTK